MLADLVESDKVDGQLAVGDVIARVERGASAGAAVVVDELVHVALDETAIAALGVLEEGTLVAEAGTDAADLLAVHVELVVGDVGGEEVAHLSETAF